MAVAKLLYEEHIDTVLATTQSIDTCSVSTLRLLKALLGIEDSASDALGNAPTIQSTKKRQATTKSAVKATKNPKIRGNANFTILNCSEAPIQCLPSNERLTLATNTFNRTLKNLGDALKTKQIPGGKSLGVKRSPLKETQGRIADVSKETLKSAARSQLLQSKSSEPQLGGRARPTPPSLDCPGLLVTAECARASLQCLRQLKAENGATEERYEQLEQGALVLISKLYGLGLIAPAIEETLHARKGLEHALRRQQEKSKNGTKLDRYLSWATVVDCVEFAYFGDNARTFALVTAFQAQVLRLIAVDEQSSACENLLRQLDPSNLGSPCSILLYGAEQGWISGEKAAIQLHAVSQSVLSICSAAALGGASQKPLSQNSPNVQFQLKCLALEMRVHWWHFAHHQPDIDNEIWTPFHRFVVSLRREAGQTTQIQFSLVKRCLDRLLGGLSEIPNALNSRTTVQPSPTVMFTLQNMAEATGSNKDSLDLLQGLKGLAADLSGLPAAIYYCKLADAMLLSSAFGIQDLIPTLETAIDILTRPLRGTMTELEDLVLQASSLRKRAMMRFKTINDNLQDIELHDESHNCLASVCIRVIFRVLHFTVRYVGFRRQGEAKASCTLISCQRRQCSPLVVQQSLNSALVAVQSNISHQYVGWELCTAALDDCLSVPTIVNENIQDEQELDFSDKYMPTTFVKVSNIFWSWYLKQKEVSACPLGLVSILERSIQALEKRTPAEMKTGFLAVKCEKAAALYTELKQFDSAHRITATAINAHIQCGTLSVASQRALTLFPQRIWGDAESSEFMLGRVLSTHARSLLRFQSNHSSSTFFDTTELKRDERALLLEKQFIALKDILVPESLHARLKEVADTLLSLYSGSAYLVHRLRFVSELLTFCSRNHLHPCRFMPEEALKMCMDEFSHEILLGIEGPLTPARSLYSSMSLEWAFQTNGPSDKLLQEFVSSHTMVTESCDSWTSILDIINDPAAVVAQVRSVVDFTDMRGLQQIKLDALLLMRRLLELQPERDIHAMVSCTAQLGLQYTRMGLTGQAGNSLATAETLLTQSTSKTLVALQWHLAYAEYLTVLSSYENAAEHLNSAQGRYEADFVSDQEHAAPGLRISQHKYLAQAAYVASILALENGDLSSAIQHAKKSVKLSIRLWSVLEKLLGVKSSSVTVERSDSGLDGLLDNMSNMTLSTVDEPKDSTSKAAAFWAYVQLHFDGLLNLSRLSAYHGSFQDAVYYAEQAKKIGDATKSGVLQCKASSFLAAHLAQAGRVDGSQLMLDVCARLYESTSHNADCLQVSMATANAQLARGEFTRGAEAVEQAQKAIYNIQAAEISCSLSETQKESNVKAVNKKTGPRSTGRPARKARKPEHAPTKLVNRGVDIDVKEVATDKVVAAPAVSTWVQKLQAEVRLLKSNLCIRSKSCEDAKDLLESVTSLARSSASDAWYSILQATLMLTDALQLLQSDAVYSLLAESTIAYPTRQTQANGVFRCQETAQREPTCTAVTTPARARKKTTDKTPSSQARLLKPKELIEKAHEELLSSSYSSLSGSSWIVANEVSGLLTRVELLSTLLSATSPIPYQTVYHLNAPKSMRWSREVASIDADMMLGDKSTIFMWPKTHDFGKTGPNPSYTVLQQQLNENLPLAWKVITVTLSNDHSEIVVSRIRRGGSPFLLQLPLSRTAAEGLDEDPFDFRTAKDELHDIIASASLTAHDAKARSNKEEKRLWWAAREALDARLSSLLNNIETLWLGGFRGIFSDRSHDEELLLRFSESFTQTLNRHLPSRRKAGARIEPRFKLHLCVLELFVALGNPDESDLDDAITDLLYFVIDILQFQGERNAYDEVDFDVVVLEISDALRSYHEVAMEASSEQGGHTILVLDKALNAFPWESLPCLEGQSVTRMPSLSCLQERLMRMRQNDEESPGLYIDPDNGAYILNPSGDLTSTQETSLILSNALF